jgi:hypothetical protein
MSDALAISGVSAVLQFYLGNMYSNLSAQFGGTIGLSAQAPDLVQARFASPTATENQVNLFLHQVTYNAAWRNVQLPSLDADGKTLLTCPPLALDLHYLLTVYGTADWQAEGLLGYALMMFHQNPVISRSDISFALNHLASTNNLSAALATCGLADQVEMIKITPATLGREEMAWLWTALKADYRPTFPFQVSVVLLQPQRNTSLALPVLRRHVQAIPIQPASLLMVTPPNNQPAAGLSDVVTVTGEFLSSVTQVVLSYAKLGVQFPVTVANNVGTSFTFVVGTQTTYPNGVPPGIYSVAGQIVDPNSTPGNVLIQQTTNALVLALAPTLPLTQAATLEADPDSASTVLVTIAGVTPSPWAGQTVALTLSSLTAPPPPGKLFSVTSTITAPPPPSNAPGTVADITAFAVANNVVTLTAANTFTAGMAVLFAGLGAATFLNGQTLVVLESGLNANEFQVEFATADVATTADTGTATPGQTLAASLTFPFPASLPTGSSYLARLTVDGVSSIVNVNWGAHPPVFTGPMVTT